MPRAVRDHMIDMEDWLEKQRVEISKKAANDGERTSKEKMHRRMRFVESVLELLNPKLHILEHQRFQFALYCSEIFDRSDFESRVLEFSVQAATYLNSCGKNA